MPEWRRLKIISIVIRMNCPEGQLQRISILRSMLLRPTFLVADEPVSMLDVSIRADIINMLQTLSKEENTAMVFISHDIATTRYISDRVAVMYLGRIVETGITDEVLHNPQHPYTKVLISNCASWTRWKNVKSLKLNVNRRPRSTPARAAILLRGVIKPVKSALRNTGSQGSGQWSYRVLSFCRQRR